MNAFLKKRDPNIERLKEQYFESGDKNTKSAYKPSDTQFSHFSEVENFIEKN